MAQTNRKPLTYNVSAETYDRVAQMFPHPLSEGRAECTETNLLTLLDAYEHPSTEDSALTQQVAELTERIAQLESERDQYKLTSEELTTRLEAASGEAQSHAAEQSETISELTRARELAEQALSDLQTEYENQKSKMASMEETIEELSKNRIDGAATVSGEIDSFTAELLAMVTERLRARTKTESLTRMQVLIDGFLKYNIQQYNLWFYEFVVSKQEILELAHKHNPQIDSYRKLQKALGIND